MSDAGTAEVDCRIGEWTFSPASNALRRGEERRRLEHRAARTLELLCRRRGDVVSQDEILAEVWNGRAISANSVPVVLKDIRKALGDDAREPRFIETVAKRGYRLLPEVATAQPQASETPTLSRARPQRRILLPATVLAAVLILAAMAFWAISRSGPAATPLIVKAAEDATGTPRYRPLARACDELVMASAQRMRGVQVFRGGENRPGAVTLRTRLILWNGAPMVMMSAQDANGAVLWTGMTSGVESRIPPEIGRAMQGLEAKLGTQAGGAAAGARG
ncbi:winged helix-turn-helix domain-containing protein [Sphingosinicella sp. BN140058]|uniref:winged helix-turn-helix domain-containing protein n=1 Tax=Sphingosinicella sp. BN140058 TaxID=1892855 RepID=UPI0013ED794B|nr:winged helix-turn-helix domain-containing protein [Sphingosinicella sp. BN140058]